MNLKNLNNYGKTCLSLSMTFWLGRDRYFQQIWDELSQGDMRPSNWKKFVEDPRMIQEASDAFGRLSDGSKQVIFTLAPFLATDFIDGIYQGETYVFVSLNQQVISLEPTDGSALEAIYAEKTYLGETTPKMFYRLALVFGFLWITQGKLTISNVTVGSSGCPVELDLEIFRSVISGE